MELPRKDDSSRLKAADGSVNRDFISKLPDSILLYILSLLPMKDAIQTSLLSKTWKRTWTALPYLIFDTNFLEEFYSSRVKKNRINNPFMKMVNNIILNRCNHQITRLEKFHLAIPDTEIYGRRDRFQNTLNRWLSHMPHIDELELNLIGNCDPAEFAIPLAILLSAKALRVMSLSGFNLMPLSNIDINFTSLRTMHLRDALLDDNIMQRLILSCPLLEDLSLALCLGIKIVYVTGLFKLKQLTVSRNYGLEKLEIDSPGLENLEITSRPGKFEVNIENCAFLRKLQVHGDFITDQWLSCLVSRCDFLEDLNIGNSQALENLKITTNTLKVLTLNTLHELVEVEIKAPHLKKFNFQLERCSLRWFGTILLNASHKLEIQLLFGLFGIGVLNYYDQLTTFLSNFNHFRTIELCGYLDKIVVPKEKRDVLVSPLYAMKHLVLFGWGKVMKFSSVELLEYMLWLCPRVDSLCIKTGTSRKNVETEIVLKLLYEDNICEDSSSFTCCKSLPIKCWQHCIVEARVEKLVGFEDCTNMKNFFLEHGKILRL